MDTTKQPVSEEGYVNRPKEEYLTDLLFRFGNETKRLTITRKLDKTLKLVAIME